MSAPDTSPSLIDYVFIENKRSSGAVVQLKRPVQPTYVHKLAPFAMRDQSSMHLVEAEYK